MTINDYDALYSKNSSSKDINSFYKIELGLILGFILLNLILF